MWKESLMTSYMICLLRYTYSQHITWLVNSAAHMWGNRPYDATINPSENMLVALLAYGKRFLHDCWDDKLNDDQSHQYKFIPIGIIRFKRIPQPF